MLSAAERAALKGERDRTEGGGAGGESVLYPAIKR